MVKAITFALLLALPSAAYPSPDPKSLIEAKTNGKWGVIDRRGRIIVPFDYDSTYISDSGIINATRDKKQTHFDANGQIIWPQYSYVSDPDRNGYRQVTDLNGLSGLVDSGGRVLLPTVFTYLAAFDGNKNYVLKSKGRAGVFSLDGKVIIPPTFFYISPLSKNGRAIAKIDRDHDGVIDEAGKWIVEPGRFEELWDYGDDGLGSAKKDGKWGFIDQAGEWVIPPIHEGVIWMGPFNKAGTTPVQIGGKWGLIDRSGKVVLAPTFDQIGFARNDSYVATIGEHQGLIDSKGRYILKPIYTSFTEFYSEGMAAAWIGKKSFVIDRSGRSVFGDRFENVGAFLGGGWAPAQLNGKWGAIETRGNWLVKPAYDCVSICFDDPPPTIVLRPPSSE